MWKMFWDSHGWIGWTYSPRRRPMGRGAGLGGGHCGSEPFSGTPRPHSRVVQWSLAAPECRGKMRRPQILIDSDKPFLFLWSRKYFEFLFWWLCLHYGSVRKHIILKEHIPFFQNNVKDKGEGKKWKLEQISYEIKKSVVRLCYVYAKIESRLAKMNFKTSCFQFHGEVSDMRQKQ